MWQQAVKKIHCLLRYAPDQYKTQQMKILNNENC